MIGRMTGRLLGISAAVLVAALTLFRLGDTPPGLYVDEAAIGLTARTLAETGRDLGGRSWPLYPLSFPDLENPMPVNPIYVYTSIPLALAGPGPWAARLPSVLWLWAAAAGIGLCASELTGRTSTAVAIGATAALTPWLFVLGRVGWEAVSYPAVTAIALWLFLRGCRRESGRDLGISGALFGLSIYTYSTARFVAPLTIAALAALAGRQASLRRHAARFGLAGILLAVPLAVSLAREPRLLTWRAAAENVSASAAGAPQAIARVAANYAGYFSPHFLFLRGDPNLRNGTGRGVLLWMWAPLVVLGLVQAWRRRREPAVCAVLAGLLLAPTGAALLATGQPHAIRSLAAAVFWAGLAAMGLGQLQAWSPRGQVAALAFAAAVALEAGPFLNDYFGAYRQRAFQHFDAGLGAVLKEAFARRSGRALCVPEDLLADRRAVVHVAYWGGGTLAPEARAALEAAGVRACGPEPPEGSLIVVDQAAGPPPARSRLILAGEPGATARYALYEN